MRNFKWLALLFLLVGCNSEDTTPFIEQGFAEDIASIESIVNKEERIQKRQIVAAEDMVLVTYEMKPAFRVQKQRVERDLKKALEKAYPSLQFVVSGDFKLHYEAQQLAKKGLASSTKEQGESTEKQSVKKEIEQLKKLAEEET